MATENLIDRLDEDDLRFLVRELQALVCAHHDIANLSDAVLREWAVAQSNECPVCSRVRRQLAA